MDVSESAARVARMTDEGGMPAVTVGQVLDVFGGSVLLIPESTLHALTTQARGAFVRAAEDASGAVVFIVPDAVVIADA